jgi:signal peptidase II
MRLLAMLAVLLSTVGCDQATKEAARSLLSPSSRPSWLGGTVKLVLAKNPGGFLGLGADLPGSARFAVFSVLVLVVILGGLLYVACSNRLSAPTVVACSLVIGGGVGNLIDRLVFSGKVTDFMVISLGPLKTGIFNVADVAAVAGVGLILYFGLRSRPVG